MTAIVVDASVALAWCFPDEASEYANAVLTGLAGYEVWGPAVWPLEVANAIAVGERRKRITQPEVRRFFELVEALTVQQDSLPLSASVSNILPLAQAYGLSAYDAAYLEVAIRRGAADDLGRQAGKSSKKGWRRDLYGQPIEAQKVSNRIAPTTS